MGGFENVIYKINARIRMGRLQLRNELRRETDSGMRVNISKQRDKFIYQNGLRWVVKLLEEEATKK